MIVFSLSFLLLIPFPFFLLLLPFIPNFPSLLYSLPPPSILFSLMLPLLSIPSCSCLFLLFPIYYLSLLPLISPCPWSAPHCLSRYYAICCQPLVYRSKMTPVRIALMLGGCWSIPMFISFLPIMQGWNKIGIYDVVSIHADAMWILASQLCQPF